MFHHHVQLQCFKDGTAIPGVFVARVSSLLQNEVELTASVFSAMQIDSYSTSHPLTNPVETPDEIDRQFSTITYTKVRSILLQILPPFINTPEVYFHIHL